jgi:hypothetical protein
LPDWLSSHPGLQERAETAERVEQSSDAGPALGEDEWRSVQKMCTAP